MEGQDEVREGAVEYEDQDKPILEKVKMMTEKLRLVIRYPQFAKF